MWIALALIGLALLVLLLVARAVLGRLPRLHRAVRRMQLREEQVLRLQDRALTLQETVAGLEQRGLVAQQRLAARSGGGGHQPPAH